ncbi:hypothetical protein E2562_023580 [Oryza meyeriana var. granulata]|uniref:AP2/ERF domain-containing protein n=1 Tax=Oryza meyeriana var. granulata TaxID=110450 RepID=A0A6G1E3B7_9ORYZ|nr:hypothetical protein E2562_023580 [Oryza meyeriana var. granulata]
MAPSKQQQMLLKKVMAKKPKTKRLSGFGLKPSAAFSRPQQPAAAPLQPRRRVRVVFEDPDATDSDSDDEDDTGASKKRYFELFIGKPSSMKQASPASTVAAYANVGKAASTSYRGVRLRKWGKWAAEIRNPFTGHREWLGTFETADAASAAYQSASRSFAEEKRRRGQRVPSASPAHSATPTPTASSSSSTSAAPFAHPSPSSVLEATKPAPKSQAPLEQAATPYLAATNETAELPNDPEFYKDILRGLQLPDVDPMDFRAGLDALDISEVPAYMDGEQDMLFTEDMLLGDFVEEDDLDLDDIGDDFCEDFPEIPSGYDFGRGDIFRQVDFCV